MIFFYNKICINFPFLKEALKNLEEFCPKELISSQTKINK